MLNVDAIEVSYDERRVLADVSFDLGSGEVLVLLGANGAGKTTLLKALNRTLAVSSGQISIEGRDLRELSRVEIARRISVVAQENETRFPMTVKQFVLAGRFARGSAFGWESEFDHVRARAAIRECDLDGLEDTLMNELSGGERQRVVLARALATDAKLLLLDEPTANLDITHQAMMFRLVRSRCATGSAAVVITHDLNLAASFGDRIIALKEGRVAAFGMSADVLTAETIRSIYGVDALVDAHPVTRRPRVTALY